MNTTAKSDLLSLLTTAQETAVPAEVPKTDLTTCVLIDGHALTRLLESHKVALRLVTMQPCLPGLS